MPLIPLGFSPLPVGPEGLGLPLGAFFEPSHVMQWFFQMPEAAQIQKVGVNIKQVYPPSPAQAFQLGLRGVNDDGSAGSTLIGIGGAATRVFTPSATGFQFFMLDHVYNASWGEFICVELKPYFAPPPPPPPQSFSNGIDVYGAVAGWSSNRMNTPYYRSSIPGQEAAKWPIFGVQSAARTYGYPILSLDPLDSTNYSRAGMRFKLPLGFGPQGSARFKVAAVRFHRGMPVNETSDLELRIWEVVNNVATVKQTATFSHTSVGAQHAVSEHGDVYFPTPASLKYGTEYYLAFDNAPQASYQAITVADNAHLDAFPGGREVYSVLYDGATWIRVNTKRLYWDLIVSEM